jgi:hypothetical protein
MNDDGNHKDGRSESIVRQEARATLQRPLILMVFPPARLHFPVPRTFLVCSYAAGNVATSNIAHVPKTASGNALFYTKSQDVSLHIAAIDVIF